MVDRGNSSNRLPVLAEEIRAAHRQVTKAATAGVAAARTAGAALIEAKASLAHGAWLPWLREVGIKPRTAQAYMQLAGLDAANAQRLAHLGVGRALRQIAEPPIAAAIRAAHVASITNVIKLGRRIRQAHDAYNADPQAWGAAWGEWCRRYLPCGAAIAAQCEIIAEHLSGTTSAERLKLPADVNALYRLAMLRRDHPARFAVAVANGRITPETTEAAAKALRNEDGVIRKRDEMQQYGTPGEDHC
jgi:hypothetical protein